MMNSIFLVNLNPVEMQVIFNQASLLFKTRGC
mgnify:FL=1